MIFSDKNDSDDEGINTPGDQHQRSHKTKKINQLKEIREQTLESSVTIP